MKAILFINNLGKDKLAHPDMENALYFCNWSSIVAVAASLGCVFLSYELSSELVMISWLFTFFNATPLILNANGFFNFSRYVLSLSPSLYLATLHLSIKTGDEKFITSILLIQIVMLTVPWMMFEYTKKQGLLTVIGLNILMIVGSVYLPGRNEHQFDNSIYANGIGVDFGLLLTAACVTFILWLSKYLYNESEKRGKDLIKSMQEKTKELERGKAELQKYIEQVEISQQIEQKRQWIDQQIKMIFDISRSNEELSKIYDKLMCTIVKALKANQGGLYSVEEEMNTCLELRAFYAYSKKKYIEQRIPVGHGLLGQCYYEKEITYLTEIPQNYTYITSGLGYATPTHLILVPLLFEDQVQGVLEIASFNEFDEFHREYLEEVSKTLGNFFYNLKILQQHSQEV